MRFVVAETKDIKIKKKKKYISQKQTDLEKGKKTSIVFEARILSSIKK